MGSSASKTARRLPKTVPSAVHPAPPTARPPPPETSAPPPTDPPAEPVNSGGEFVYGGREEGRGPLFNKNAARPVRSVEGKDGGPLFSGEKDDQVVKDGMDPGIDPQFLANLHHLGPVSVHESSRLVRSPPRAQRTLNARRAEYTNPTATPPRGMLNAGLLTQLLDTLKSLPAGADPTAVYKQYGLTAAEMEPIRKWVNSPSVGSEEVFEMHDSGNQQVEQTVEMTAVWVDAQDKDAPKR